jgi:hypothetical protein
VTSRPSRIPDLGPPFSYYRLEPFSQDDIEEFLGRWFGEDLDLKRAVLNKISSDSALSVFCKSPLILTLYAVLAQKRPVSQLPVRRTDIYDLVVDFLLDKWDNTRSVKNNFDKPSKEFLLEMVALEAQRVGARVFSRSFLHDLGASLFVDSRMSGTPEDLIGEVIYRSSLLRPTASRDIEFPHLSFQEYFAAKRLFRIHDKRLIEGSLLDEWWRGTFIFYFGLKRSMDEILIASKKSGKVMD